MAEQVPIASPPASPRAEWPEQGQWTYEDWLRLPDDGYRYEVLDGVLYMAPPPAFSTHQRPIVRLLTRMSNFVEAHQSGEVGVAPTGVRLPTQPVPVQPDIFYIAAGRTDVSMGRYVEGAPDLIVEVLSPGNWLYDRKEKYQAYQAAGVREYWIVDACTKTIEVYVLKEGVYLLTGKWGAGERARSQVLSGFEVAIDDLFHE